MDLLGNFAGKNLEQDNDAAQAKDRAEASAMEDALASKTVANQEVAEPKPEPQNIGGALGGLNLAAAVAEKAEKAEAEAKAKAAEAVSSTPEVPKDSLEDDDDLEADVAPAVESSIPKVTSTREKAAAPTVEEPVQPMAGGDDLENDGLEDDLEEELNAEASVPQTATPKSAIGRTPAMTPAQAATVSDELDDEPTLEADDSELEAPELSKAARKAMDEAFKTSKRVPKISKIKKFNDSVRTYVAATDKRDPKKMSLPGLKVALAVVKRLVPTAATAAVTAAATAAFFAGANLAHGPDGSNYSVDFNAKVAQERVEMVNTAVNGAVDATENMMEKAQQEIAGFVDQVTSAPERLASAFSDDSPRTFANEEDFEKAVREAVARSLSEITEQVVTSTMIQLDSDGLKR